MPPFSISGAPVTDAEVRAVGAVLAFRRASCLERALVMQAVGIRRGKPRDVVVGVGRPDGEFGAHAWLDGAPDGESGRFAELVRFPPPVP
jgi:hypothetical protein